MESESSSKQTAGIMPDPPRHRGKKAATGATGAATTAAPSGLPPLAAEKDKGKETAEAPEESVAQRREIRQFLQSHKRTLVKEHRDMERKTVLSVENSETNSRLLIKADEKLDRKELKRAYHAGLRVFFPDLSSPGVSVAVTPTHHSQGGQNLGSSTGQSSIGIRRDSFDAERCYGEDDVLYRHGDALPLPRLTFPSATPPAEVEERGEGGDLGATVSASDQAKFARWLSDAIQRERDLQRKMEDAESAASQQGEALARSVEAAQAAAEKIRSLAQSSRPTPLGAPPAELKDRACSPIYTELPVPAAEPCPTAAAAVPLTTSTTTTPTIAAAAACGATPVVGAAPRLPSPGDGPGAEHQRRAWAAVEDAIQNSLVLHQSASAWCDEALALRTRKKPREKGCTNWAARVTVLIHKVREEVNYRRALEAAPHGARAQARGQGEAAASPETISGINADTFKDLTTELRSCIVGLQAELRARREELAGVEHLLVQHGRRTVEAHDRAADLLEPRGCPSHCSSRSAASSSGRPAPPGYISSMWGEERQCRENWLRRAAEVVGLFRRRMEEVEDPLRDIEQAFIIGGAASGGAQWKLLLGHMYNVAVNGEVWSSDGDGIRPFPLQEKTAGQPRALWRTGCLLLGAVALASLHYRQYQAQ